VATTLGGWLNAGLLYGTLVKRGEFAGDARLRRTLPRIGVATLAMGAALLTAEEYQDLQTLGLFDTTTSSWVQTPDRIRKLGGALFCDRRYDTVFVYHNGAESYYAARGFRCSLRV